MTQIETIKGYRCSICGKSFTVFDVDGMESYRGHKNDKGEPCEGGIPD